MTLKQFGQQSVKRNIVFNVFGGVWTIFLNLVAIRFELRILGPEAYGLISFGTSLQVLFTLFDLGLSTTVVREVAGDNSPGREKSRELVQVVAFIYWTVAIIVGLVLFL